MGEDGRDDPLPEGIVEGVVDRGERNAEPRGGIAIDGENGGEPLGFEIAGDVLELRQLPEPLNQFRDEVRERGLDRGPPGRTDIACG